jgi:hypothetical protein
MGFNTGPTARWTKSLEKTAPKSYGAYVFESVPTGLNFMDATAANSPGGCSTSSTAQRQRRRASPAVVAQRSRQATTWYPFARSVAAN